VAETQRTYAELLALLADNTSADISPQDVRDVLYSQLAPYGTLSISNNFVSTAFPTPGTFYTANGTTTLNDAYLFDMPGNNQLRYTGLVPRRFQVSANCSFLQDSASQRLGISIAKNGTPVPGSLATLHSPSIAGQYGSATVGAFVQLANNDYLSVQWTNYTSQVGGYMHTMYLMATGMLME